MRKLVRVEIFHDELRSLIKEHFNLPEGVEVWLPSNFQGPVATATWEVRPEDLEEGLRV